MMGRRLFARKARPSLIISSPATRALTTAKSIAAALSYPAEFLQLDEQAYLASPPELLDLIQKQSNDFADLMIVGHNPGLTDLINQMLPDLALNNLPTGGLVTVDIDIDDWAKLLESQPSLVYYDYPKNPEVLLIED